MAKRKPTSADTPETSPPAAEGYTVLARRYRPQLFADLVGQEPVAQALVNALQSNRVAHAYLFTGARGVGKTSTARILAKALNCEKGPTATPCGVCESCRAITSGDDVDVLEIDGASNRGIDEVREIRQNVQFRPSISRYKIYIIDEVHMLTAPAFNALLKTLEEPPPHVKFIFATTEVQKIPITILSRCQRFDFAGIGTGRIVERLRQIVASEGMEADDEALELVARRAGGSMRDAQSLLDQLLAFGESRLSVQHVHQLLGTANEDRVAELAAAVLGRDAKRALELLAATTDEGVQLGEILDQLIEYWRDLMVAAAAGGEGVTLNATGKHREALKEQSKQVKLDTILAGLEILVSSKARARGSNHGRVLLEMALVRLSRLDDLVPLAQLTQWLGQAPDPRTQGAAATRSVQTGTAAPMPRLAQPPEAVKKKALNGADGAAAAAQFALTPESLPQLWPQILEQAGMALGVHLRKSHVQAISGPNTLAIRFPTGYNHPYERCQEPTNLQALEQLLRKLTGQAWRVKCELLVGADPSVPSAALAGTTEPPPARSRRDLEEKALQVPLVKRAVDVLGATFVRPPEEGFGDSPTPSAVRPDENATEDP
ncbi:MAG TPA: DNA polymerase III subunit gamma/tau [Gemmataceae bacterium]|nr:DNA polymerase III subunit gamma/tau [Gemmataceae bacterium]